MRALATALLLLVLPAALTAQTRWFEAPEQGFRINVPTDYQTNTYTEGTDVIHGFLSPDQNVAVRIRSVPLPQAVDLAMVIGLFEGSVLDGAERLVLQDYELNGTSGQMAGYRWNWQGTPVIVGAYYTQTNGHFYAVWSAIPENLFQARTGESDAIINTFSTVAVTASGPSGIGGTVTPPREPTSIGGSVTPPTERPPEPPARAPRPETRPPNRSAEYVTLVEETAGLEFSIPVGFEVTDRSPGQQIWQGPGGGEDAEVKMVIQTIDKSPGDYSNVEEAYLTLMEQIRDNASADEVDKRRVRSDGGLDVPVYTFDLRQGQRTTRFVYAIAETANHITMLSFLGPVAVAYRQELHAQEAATSMRAVGGQAPTRPQQPTRPPETTGGGGVAPPPAGTGSGNLSGPAGPHVVTLAVGNDRSSAREASAGYGFWGQNFGLRMETPSDWTRTGHSGSQMSYDIYSIPGGAQASWRLIQIPTSAQSFEEVLAAKQETSVGTVTLNGNEFHAQQSIRHMGPPTNMRLRSDCLTWFHGRTTYTLCFEGDASTWNQHVRPVAEHMLSTLKILPWG